MRVLSFATLAACAVLASLPSGANAGLLGGTADFTETLDLPSTARSVGPRVLQSFGRIIDGTVQLSEADQVSNPSGWRDSLTVSLGDTLLTLTPTARNTYQTIVLTITNIVVPSGEVITGFTQTASGAFNSEGSNPFTTSWSFTADSLTVSYSVNTQDRSNFLLFGAGSDTFAITTAVADVPEPASFLLLGAGLAGLARVRRRS